MKVSEIMQVLNAEILTCAENLDYDVHSGCGADLMSDVMAYVKDSIILLTGLVNPHVVRTAEMMDIKVICFVRGKRPSSAVIELAKEKGITILTTDNTLYISCGLLYSKGIVGRGAGIG
jgi:predicted transcriptional regulator